MTEPPTLRADPAEIGRAVRTLFRPSDVVEMRVLNTARDGTVSGYFSDHDLLVKALAGRNGDPGIYVTLNPVIPALLARAANHTRTRVKLTTADHDIARRCWLPIDCDPVRPGGISSTDAEHEMALERARKIRYVLAKEGWPPGVLANSGNGAHDLCAIDLPNDEDSARLAHDVLKALAARFDDERVKIDTTLFNAARIIKAYGTIARKGDDTPDRPHRPSRLLEVPEGRIEAVPPELLREMADRGNHKPPPPRQPHGWSRFDVEAFIARNLAARAPVPYEGGRKWILEYCPFNSEHTASSAAIFERSDGSLGFRCQHNSCAGKAWRDVRELFDGPRQQWHPRSEPPPKPEGVAAPPQTPQAGSLIIRPVSEIEPQPVRWLWHHRIALGKPTIYAGMPGLGKSQATVDLAACVSTGAGFPGDSPARQPASVLILSAEDDAADTLRPRLAAAGADLTRVHVIESVISGYTADGEQHTRLFSLQEDCGALSRTLDRIGDVALLIIDPVSAYLGDCDSHKNSEVRGLLAPLSALVAKHGTALVAVTHLNKPGGGGDAMSRVTGSLAFIAASRAAYLFAPDPQDPGRCLFVPLKNNLGPKMPGLAYQVESATVEGGITTSRIKWCEDLLDINADEVLAAQTSRASRRDPAQHEAEEWLTAALAFASAPRPAAELYQAAEAAGISPTTLKRAAVALGVVREKTSLKGPWRWSLPPDPEETKSGPFEETKSGLFGDDGSVVKSPTPPEETKPGLFWEVVESKEKSASPAPEETKFRGSGPFGGHEAPPSEESRHPGSWSLRDSTEDKPPSISNIAEETKFDPFGSVGLFTNRSAPEETKSGPFEETKSGPFGDDDWIEIKI